jgi:hypothetical protein
LRGGLLIGRVGNPGRGNKMGDFAMSSFQKYVFCNFGQLSLEWNTFHNMNEEERIED